MDNFLFSFIVLNENTKDGLKTLESLHMQTIDFAKIQIIVINRDGRISEEAFKNQFPGDLSQLVYMDGCAKEGSGILEEAIEQVEGTYLCMTKSGVTYQEDALKHINDEMGNRDNAVVAIQMKSERMSQIAKEHNAYRNLIKKEPRLEKSYRIIVALYPAYFIKTGKVSKEGCKKINEIFWFLDQHFCERIYEKLMSL
ncbi:hypothetical protein LQZ18_04590 [Lachnospiraceae bacterium ZAX-1]